jgi:glycine oxidase
MYPWRYPQAVNDLAKHGKNLYLEWNEKLRPISGIDFEIHETGMLIFDQTDFEIGLNYAKLHNEPMQACEHLQQQQIQQINPRISNQFEQAIHFPQIANVRNPRLLKSIIGYLKQHPQVQFYENTWIEKFIIQNAQIHAVESTRGERFEADHYVISTGAWSEHWSSQLQLQIPIAPVQGQMLLFKGPENWLPTMCMNEVMYLIPRRDGHIVCGSSMNHLGFDHRPSTQVQQDIYKASLNMVPALAELQIVKQWAGLRPSSPTGIPYIGQMPNIDNLWANFGHYRNGLCMGPASAQLLRQLVLKQTTIVDPQVYTPNALVSTL